jgi:lipopolysaccharide assembly outer membrane protein LptD (OstA)
VRLDFLSQRGVGAGFESEWGNTTTAAAATGPSTPGTPLKSTRDGRAGVRFRSYFIDDKSPGTNKTSLNREPIDTTRYRVSFQSRTYLTEDIYASIDINKLSDARFLQDFEAGEFRRNPNPDNAISLTKWDEITASLSPDGRI